MMKQVYDEASVIFSLIIDMDGFDAFSQLELKLYRSRVRSSMK
jgi:hypothetical protein